LITSKLDFIITTKDTEGESEVITTNMSDHDMVISEIHGKKGTLRPRRKAQKEMFYSNLINEIKEKHIKYYLRYLLQMISMVMNDNKKEDGKRTLIMNADEQGMTYEKQKKILDELKEKIPLIVINKPRQIYQVE